MRHRRTKANVAGASVLNRVKDLLNLGGRFDIGEFGAGVLRVAHEFVGRPLRNGRVLVGEVINEPLRGGRLSRRCSDMLAGHGDEPP